MTDTAVTSEDRAAVFGWDYARMKSTAIRAGRWTYVSLGAVYAITLAVFLAAMPYAVGFEFGGQLIFGVIAGILAAAAMLIAAAAALHLGLVRLPIIQQQAAAIVISTSASLTILAAIWALNRDSVSFGLGLIAGFGLGSVVESANDRGILKTIERGGNALEVLAAQLSQFGAIQSILGYRVWPLVAQRLSGMLVRLAAGFLLVTADHLVLAALVIIILFSAVLIADFVLGRKNRLAAVLSVDAGATLLFIGLAVIQAL